MANRPLAPGLRTGKRIGLGVEAACGYEFGGSRRQPATLALIESGMLESCQTRNGAGRERPRRCRAPGSEVAAQGVGVLIQHAEPRRSRNLKALAKGGSARRRPHARTGTARISRLFSGCRLARGRHRAC